VSSQPIPINSESFTAWLVYHQFQVIEIGDGIRLGPEADLAGGQGPITLIEHAPVVVKDLDPAALHDDPEAMPPSDVNGLIVIGDHLPNAFVDSIQADVLFKGIRAGKIVIAIILRSPNQPPSHVAFSTNGTKTD